MQILSTHCWKFPSVFIVKQIAVLPKGSDKHELKAQCMGFEWLINNTSLAPAGTS